MRKVHLFEEKSCHAPTGAHLVERLQRWYRSTAEVRVYDLAAPDELVPLPAELFFRLQEEGPSCLPALVVEGTVVSAGKLPSFSEAVELIEAQTPAPAVAATGRAGANTSSCCTPNTAGTEKSAGCC